MRTIAMINRKYITADVAIKARPMIAMSDRFWVWVSRLSKMIRTVKAQGLNPSARAITKTKMG